MSNTNLDDPANGRLIVSEETWFEVEAYVNTNDRWVCLFSAVKETDARQHKEGLEKRKSKYKLRLTRVTKKRENLDEE